MRPAGYTHFVDQLSELTLPAARRRSPRAPLRARPAPKAAPRRPAPPAPRGSTLHHDGRVATSGPSAGSVMPTIVMNSQAPSGSPASTDGTARSRPPLTTVPVTWRRLAPTAPRTATSRRRSRTLEQQRGEQVDAGDGEQQRGHAVDDRAHLADLALERLAPAGRRSAVPPPRRSISAWVPRGRRRRPLAATQLGYRSDAAGTVPASVTTPSPPSSGSMCRPTTRALNGRPSAVSRTRRRRSRRRAPPAPRGPA